jgi:anti-sigma regulatory factor (Ser/Thr protein kinase)
MAKRTAQGAGFAAPDVTNGEAPGRVAVVLTPAPHAISAARRAVDTLLEDADPTDEFTFLLRLVVSELMTNAVVHGSGDDEIQLDLALHRDYACVTIHNLGAPVELAKLRQPRPGGGRGLEIVAAVSDRWGLDTGAGGTIMTARVPRHA